MDSSTMAPGKFNGCLFVDLTFDEVFCGDSFVSY